MNTKFDKTRPILAIDTSTSFLSLALQHNQQIYTQHLLANNKQAEWILPQIALLLQQADVAVSDLAAIVYAQGAGAFTGLRIGLGVAQGLATPFDLPLIGVPCLDAVAYQIPDCTCVLAATDARMNEVFYAFFDTLNHHRLSDYCVDNAQEIKLPENILASNVKGVGNAFALPNAPQFSGSDKMPTALDYLRLAQTGRYAVLSVEQAELLYVRNKIALTAAEQAARKFQAA